MFSFSFVFTKYSNLFDYEEDFESTDSLDFHEDKFRLQDVVLMSLIYLFTFII